MIDVETYAAINAELARDGVDRLAVLAAHGLDEDSWQRADDHWQEELSRAMDADVEADGVPQAIADVSTAFTRAQQATAGDQVISLDRFARATRQISQSKDVGASLKALGLGLPEFLKANQHWCLKMVHDPELAERFRRIVAGEE